MRPCWLTVLLYLALGLPKSLAFQQQPITDRLRTLNPNVLTEAARKNTHKSWPAMFDAASWPPIADPQRTGARSQIARNGNNSRKKRFSCWKPLLGRFRHRPRTWRFTSPKLFLARDSRSRILFSKAGPDCGSLPTCILLNRSGRECPASCFVTATTIPRSQGELQDMGMTWARQGYLVLVMDQLGHGERRQHPFRSAADYAGPFEVNRQDYYFRYNLGIQLQLIGDSLMGWMVWDLRRGVDLLLSRPGIDPANIILMGSVAGGGDPAAVAAALGHPDYSRGAFQLWWPPA